MVRNKNKIGQKEQYYNNFENFYWNVDHSKPNFIEVLDPSAISSRKVSIKNDNFRQIYMN
eukprot:CAMPEP_0116915852 /NCGR_PEP_ID=MMETSP0467-20121206/18176_1 /TAXON_ID=283647 /ORGANISM="Mesodinium pulex, Strain SPMC105" /LENGTH=59 /DNA_ID=CAMNT_0004592597 /DNA_START=571 /DNA_END=750 /DNA_ORIENTATION=-